MAPPAPGQAPVALATAKVVKLQVRATPGPADVYRAVDGVRLGVTPLTLEVSATKGEMVLVVKKDGYDSETVRLPADRDGRAEVKLDKQKAPKKKIGKEGKKGVDEDGALDPFENRKSKR
jgi:hypothetical protein